MNSPDLPEESLRRRIRDLHSRLLLRDRARIAARFKIVSALDRAGLENLCHLLENLSAHNLARFADRLNADLDGELPIRVTHNDTKTNNILFDKDTLDPLVVIDLDTCMPGLACYDFGDTIRFAACTAEEDQPDGMSLDLDLMRAYTKGYLEEVRDVLTEAEIQSLPVGAAVITLELASRFLLDYLVGDKYFRIDYPEQNLRRAQAQLVLFQDMMKHMEEMQRIVQELSGSAKEPR